YGVFLHPGALRADGLFLQLDHFRDGDARVLQPRQLRPRAQQQRGAGHRADARWRRQTKLPPVGHRIGHQRDDAATALYKPSAGPWFEKAEPSWPARTRAIADQSDVALCVLDAGIEIGQVLLDYAQELARLPGLPNW